MHRPLAKKPFRANLESRLEDLAGQTEDLRKQVAERAPGLRDQLMDALPDKDQLLDLYDDVFDRLPDGVADRLPEKVKPKRSRLKKVAVVGAAGGIGAAVFAVLRRRGTAAVPAEPFPEPVRPAATATPPKAPPVPPTEVASDANGAAPMAGKKA